MPTTATVFLQTLSEAGVTHAFVNWGNDHPSLLEDLERQRVENGGKSLIEIVTCPNEMVALSAAQGYAQVTGKPAAVIVHVDVGTQALAGAVHNVDKGRTPVLIFAGASPFSAHGEFKGSKNEWPMWVQDIPDQPAIVRQYMRHTAQIQSGKNVAKVVARALQFATSDPQGPTYLWARREVMEEDLDPAVANAKLDFTKWPPVQPSALEASVVQNITEALLLAKFPLIITAHTGRNPRTVPLLMALSNAFSIAICASCPSAVCVPYSYPHFLGTSFHGKNHLLDEADVIVVLDADVPWVDACDNAPKANARVFLIDPDPLKANMGWSHIDAEIICRADSEVALNQLVTAGVEIAPIPESIIDRGKELKKRHDDWIDTLTRVEVTSLHDLQAVPTVPGIIGALRDSVQELTPSNGQKTLWINEGISNYHLVFDHVRPQIPGSMIASGATSLGYALGAAVGATLGGQVAKKDYELIVVVVGDGDYLFSVPSSAYWMARRYNTPHLTIVLNNGGWASPKNSMKGVYPQGHGSKATGNRLTIGFGPEMPDYGGIAAAAGGAWARKVEKNGQLKEIIDEAVKVVLNEKRCAVVDCIIESI
ncbi:thiamine diphosphate-binding protein [Panus rudis PR-1116 ss-1]|nr:thiamine diphosphate-binding protein [Panus rudis PR-1116 ss-1]